MHRWTVGSAAVCCLISLFAIGAVSAAQAETKGQRAEAQSSLRACIKSTRALTVVFLVDESRSLYLPNQNRGSDPTAKRVDGLKAALGGLDRIARGTGIGDPVKVNVLFAGFSSEVDPAPGETPLEWLTLGGTQTGAAYAEAAGFADRYSGEGTDYVTALQAARGFLYKKSDAGGCQAIVFFTDGQYELAKGAKAVGYAPGIGLSSRAGIEKAEKIGVEKLCRPGGLMDQLASQNVWVFTVGLMKPGAPGEELLQRIAANQHGDCGGESRTSKTKLVTASETSELFFGFGSLMDGSSKTPKRGNGEFRTVPGLKNFLLRANTSPNGVVTIAMRNHDSVQFRKGGPTRATINGTKLSAVWVSDSAVEIDGEFDGSNDWVGSWDYTFSDPDNSLSTLSLYANADLKLVSAPTVHRGEMNRLKFELVDVRGNKIEGGRIVQSAAPSFRLLNQATDEVYPMRSENGESNGDIVAVVNVPGDVIQPRFSLLADVKFDVAPDIDITPLSDAFDIRNELPRDGGYPEVTPEAISFGSVQGKTTAVQSFRVVGTKGGVGCAWFGKPEIDLDPGDTKLAVSPSATSQATCEKVSPGQVKNVQLKLIERNAHLGPFRASVPIFIKSGRSDIAGLKVETVSVPVTASIGPERNLLKRLAITLLFVLLGLAIPLALLHALNLRNAKFADAGFLKYFAADVVVWPAKDEALDEAELTLKDKSDFEVSHEDLKAVSTVGTSADARELIVDQFAIEAVASGNFEDRHPSLFSGPYAIGTAGGETLLAGSPNRTLASWRDRTRHEVPLDLPRSWMFVPRLDQIISSGDGFDDAADGSIIEGRLAVIVAAAGQVENAKKTLAEAADTLAKVDWRAVAREGIPTVPTSDSAGTGPTEVGLLNRIFRKRNGAQAASDSVEDSVGWDASPPGTGTGGDASENLGSAVQETSGASDVTSDEEDGWTL